MRSPVIFFAAAGLALLTATSLAAQGTAADYARAQGLRGRFAGLALNVSGEPHWVAGSSHFWYRRTVPGGYEVIMVDPDTPTKAPAFDHARLATALSSASGNQYTAVTLPFTEPPVQDAAGGAGAGRGGRGGGGASGALTFVNQEHGITFAAGGFMYSCDLTAYTCAKGAAAPGPNGGRGRGGAAAAPVPPPEDDDGLLTSPPMVEEDIEDGVDYTWNADGTQSPPQAPPAGRGGAAAAAEQIRTSPDGDWDALIQNFNVFLRRKGETQTVPLSYDGSEGNYYSLRSIQWSPDSKHLVAYHTRPGYQREIWYVQSSPTDQIQPKHSTLVYAKPGDTLDIAQPELFDLVARKELHIANTLFPNAFEIAPARWWQDSRGFTFEYNQRGHQLYRLIEVDAATGNARALVDETSATFVDYRPLAQGRTDTGKKFVHYIDDGKEFIWASERDGWEHLYLYDGATDKVKNQITRGPWVVRYVDRVDDQARQIWFRASGMNPGQDPYFLQYYRINFDGTGLTPLTDADGEHTVRYSPDNKYYTDTWSRVDQAPHMQLRRTADRKVVMDLDSGDTAQLVAAGWRPPEVFVAKGRDGKTDIWGVIFKPTNFDPSKKYPVVENIYAGPQGSFVPKTFSANMQPLAELGFVVVQIDGMGTNNRSRAFHDVAWQNLADAGFPDRILWHQAVAAKYPWYDITRVGVYGTSAGAQSSLGALLFHPDFYKVAVSNSGCHDNRMDKIWWNEQYMGWPVGPQYAASSNVDNAWRLQGKVLLVMGEMDNNVDPSSTLQVVNQFIEHNKRFDLLYVPGGGHGAGS